MMCITKPQRPPLFTGKASELPENQCKPLKTVVTWTQVYVEGSMDHAAKEVEGSSIW